MASGDTTAPATSTKSKTAKTAAAREADKTARGRTSSALADRLRQRSDARAARSVEEDLLAPAPASRTLTLVTEPELVAEATTADPDTPGAAGAAGAAHLSTNTPSVTPEPAPSSAPAAAEPPKPAGEETPATQGPGGARARASRPAAEAAAQSAVPATEVSKPVAGPDGRLELSGERITKMTLELPVPLVDALARWERDETAATGQRVYRERLIDRALSDLPEDTDELLVLARDLPEGLRYAETEQVGTRVRESIQRRLKNLRPELRVRRVRDIYLRHIYAAAIAQYLTALGVTIDPA